MLASMDPKRVLRTYVSTELELMLKNAPSNAELRSVILHDVFTDLSVSFEAAELITSFANMVTDKYHVRPGFATRNFSKFIDFASKCGLNLDQIVVLTPFNKAGFQMNPSRGACEETLRRNTEVTVIAMSILAAGFLKLNDAMQYLHEQPLIKSFVVGASTQEHARETFSRLRATLG